MGRIHRYIIWVLIFCAAAVKGQVQLTLTSDKVESAHVEPFTVKATLRMDTDVKLTSDLPDLLLPPTFDVDIESDTKWQEQPHDVLKVLERSWVIMPFDTGLLVINALSIPYEYFEQADTAYSDELAILVYAEPSETADLYPIKDIERVNPSEYGWLWILIFILLILIVGWLLYKFLRKQKTKPVQSAPIPQAPEINPLKEAITALEEMMAIDYSDENGPDRFFVAFTFILKTYFQHKTAGLAHGWTSEETIRKLAGVLDVDGRYILEQLLQQSDLTKFAGQNHLDAKSVIIATATKWLRRYDNQIGKLDLSKEANSKI